MMANGPGPDHSPRIVSVGTANPPDSYTQPELIDLLQIEDRRIRSLFLNGSINRRYLRLPLAGPDRRPQVESQGELLRKHRSEGIRLGAVAIQRCLDRIGAVPADVRYLCCVTSTGWLTPGLSAWLIRELRLSADCGRVDVVGMGCNAGLNGLNAVAGWSASHPGELALLLCVEVCSAAYVFDGSIRTAVVNSLFGDGAAAVAVRAGQVGQVDQVGSAGQAVTGGQAGDPAIVGFRSCLIPDSIDAMRYDWDETAGKFSFYIDRHVPYVIGAHAEQVVDGLLADAGLRRQDIAHWIVHSGGKKVIDSVRVNLGLTGHDLRHTSGVLRDYGNLSSASFLFSYERLREEQAARRGDHGVLMTMGPGSTIEVALMRW